MSKIIVVGAGHAGCEAAFAIAKMGVHCVLVTGSLKNIATLPCNPSIGGPAKGNIVREIDSLGGMMGKIADQSALQVKMLNKSKGPAVQSLRMQVDKEKYPKLMADALEKKPNIAMIEGYVTGLIIENKQVLGVLLENKEIVFANAVIICTGTYLNSSILIGNEKIISGPDSQRTTFELSKQLKELNLDVIRLKTGTPPRIFGKTIDFTKTTIQPGDKVHDKFSNDKNSLILNDLPCYLTHTTARTHEIIINNLHKSAMFSGNISGLGPRYCPSIEDKIYRFKEKLTHQVFLEPETSECREYYLQGLSTSMPRNLQKDIIHSVPGLEKAVFSKDGYAIEYDAVNPICLFANLETKNIKNLFLAGQINGTSGYEEAAGQGLMAGINAVLKIKNQAPFILRRDEAYIGVLIDDLITKGTKEPYRLLTSRAEFRLLLRHENNDERLLQYGYDFGLINQARYDEFIKNKEQVNSLIKSCENFNLYPNQATNDRLTSLNLPLSNKKTNLLAIIKTPEFQNDTLKHFIHNFDDDVINKGIIKIKYDGYIKKAYAMADKLRKNERIKISPDFDYQSIHNLSSEAREKLMKIRPSTLGQASRIIGVNPPDLLLIAIKLRIKND